MGVFIDIVFGSFSGSIFCYLGMHAFAVWRCMFGALLVYVLAECWVHVFVRWGGWAKFVRSSGQPATFFV